MGKLIIISGPSCVGKSPLFRALGHFYPDLLKGTKPLILYNDRRPRPNEKDGVDYYFRSTEYVQGLRRKKDFLVFEVRGDLQAVDVKELKGNLEKQDVLFEGNPFVGSRLLGFGPLKKTDKISVFISPLCMEEILHFRSSRGAAGLDEIVTDIMRRKLSRRTRHQKGMITGPAREDIERRARSAFGELKYAYLFDFVIPNHDGEDSENWQAFGYPVGDARRTMLALVDILTRGACPMAEIWPHCQRHGKTARGTFPD